MLVKSTRKQDSDACSGHASLSSPDALPFSFNFNIYIVYTEGRPAPYMRIVWVEDRIRGRDYYLGKYYGFGENIMVSVPCTGAGGGTALAIEGVVKCSQSCRLMCI